MGNIVAIVGRPNVGKSTLFNRLTGSRHAIIEETAGVTRDRNYGRADWNGIEFSVIDTGGYVVGSDDMFETEIRKQVSLAVEEADAIIFVVDAKDGISPLDMEIAAMLRRSEKKVFLAVNKVDTPDKTAETTEFYGLGFPVVYPLSSMNGSGTGELLDEVCKQLTKQAGDELPDLPKIAIVGRPNVGKSSLLNTLLGIERNIVTPVPGTTRDSIHTRYKAFGFDFLLIDTAGLRKKSKVKENIEFYSVMRSVKAIENSDVCLLMVDAAQGFEEQDVNIFSLIHRNHKGVVIVVNKWDLVEKDHHTHLQFDKIIRNKIAPFTDVPILFTSVPKKQRIHKVLEVAMEVYNKRSKRIPTSRLNEVMLPLVAATPPPMSKGKYIKIKYVTQLRTPYPSFVLFCNLPQYIKEPYGRFVVNKIRENFDFTGVPIQVYFRKK